MNIWSVVKGGKKNNDSENPEEVERIKRNHEELVEIQKGVHLTSATSKKKERSVVAELVIKSRCLALVLNSFFPLNTINIVQCASSNSISINNQFHFNYSHLIYDIKTKNRIQTCLYF